MIEIINADLSLKKHAEALLTLLNEYALDLMGGKEALPEFVKTNLVAELKRRLSAHVILAFVEGNPAGLMIGFEGFSTFACKPLINIHDVVVAEKYRGRGLSRKMLSHMERIAQDSGCCKLTLEVLEGNTIAQTLYRSSGFEGYALDPTMGKALFWQKKL
ncbi:MAG: GNAT family N-acetyltransferase [Burkholderiaceae bacterium]